MQRVIVPEDAGHCLRIVYVPVRDDGVAGEPVAVPAGPPPPRD